jgi:inorganic triphosphatase YgiF
MKQTILTNCRKLAVAACITIISISGVAAQGNHPAYLKALSDLRAARWLIDHRTGNWQQSKDEQAAVGAIDAAIAEINKAAIDDHKNLNDHPQMQEIPDHAGRLQKAIEILRATRADVNQREDDRFAQGMKARALQHIDNAIKATQGAIMAVGAPAPAPADHPAYLKALSDLRAARWLIDHRPGNWQQGKDEAAAVGAIDAAISEIKRAAIDDHKDINDHPQVQEIPDRGGRLRKALDLLRATRGDVNQREDDRFAQGLKARALQHVDNAIKATEGAMAAGGFK